MNILLTGATGYIGKRLLPELIRLGHHVVCCVRDKDRFNPPSSLRKSISIIEIDLLKEETLKNIPKDIDAAYYLVHSMSSSDEFIDLEERSANNFKKALRNTDVNQVIYLSGIINDETLSKHLLSRKKVEDKLAEGKYHLTTLRAGIIIGSGSASFEIIRDLVEKLPIMITPKWLNTKCQPIGIADVIRFLTAVLEKEETYDRNFDIGSPDVLTYREMLLQYAEVRNLKRRIFIVPVMTPKLSSYWLYFVTSTTYKLAVSLVDSMKVEVVCRNDDINKILNIKPLKYKTALQRTFSKIENNQIISSWKDSFISGRMNINISDFIDVPQFGTFKDQRKSEISDKEKTIDRIWKIGGKNGWYYANWLWEIRGFLDKLAGGVGLRRGRSNPNTISVGDSIDFWRVLYADKDEGRLLLFAEMKLPGEAWLEFKIKGDYLYQNATFRPLGIKGRLYWYSILPFHGLIFNGMLKELTKR